MSTMPWWLRFLSSDAATSAACNASMIGDHLGTTDYGRFER
jgi:hypothetical protein